MSGLMLPCTDLVFVLHGCIHCTSQYLRKMIYLEFGFAQLFLVELAELVARGESADYKSAGNLLHDA